MKSGEIKYVMDRYTEQIASANMLYRQVLKCDEETTLRNQVQFWKSCARIEVEKRIAAEDELIMTLAKYEDEQPTPVEREINPHLEERTTL